jgi:hypothetical protein
VGSGDYFNAYLLLKEVKSSLDDLRIRLEEIKKPIEEGSRRTIYLIVGVVVIAVVGSILAYLFWPTKTAPIPKLSVSKEDIWFRLKRKWGDVRRKKYRYRP